MPNYQNGKVYKIWSLQTDLIYIGSTTQSLSMRLSTHKANYKRWKVGIGHYVTSFELLKYDDVKIELIENCPCNNKEELNRREGQTIRDVECVNKRIEGRTQKERYEDNREQIREQQRQYQQDNREQIREQQRLYHEDNKEEINERRRQYYQDNKERFIQKAREYRKENKEKIKEYREKNKDRKNKERRMKITCSVCNIQMNRSSKALHERTQKHKKNISN